MGRNGGGGGGGGRGRSRATGGGSLTDADKSAVELYTNSDFDRINRALRGEDTLTDSIRDRVESLNNALDKLPDFEGTTYRTVDLLSPAAREKFLAEHAVGSTVKYDSFTSASKSKAAVGFDHAGVSTNKLTIKSKRGKSIEKFSTSPKEQEILFKTGSKFRITDRKQRQDGGYNITLREL